MIELDGAFGEGGGQILRTALFLSFLTNKPFRIFNIRKNRPQPGLKPQHLHIIKALQKFADCKVEGDQINSLDLTFIPGQVNGGRIDIDIGTAGSITLFLQSILPIALLARQPVEINVTGGTDVPFSMSMDYYRYLIMPYWSAFADSLNLQIERRGFYPKGGGKVYLRVKAERAILQDPFTKLGKLMLVDRGRLEKIKIFSVAWEELAPRKVAQRQAEAAKKVLSSYKIPVETNIEYCPAYSGGTAITIIAEFENGIKIGTDNLGKRGKPAEAVGKETAENMLKEIESQACVDTHQLDNLITLLALRRGKILASNITNHAQTNIWTCSNFFPELKFTIQDNTVLCE